MASTGSTYVTLLDLAKLYGANNEIESQPIGLLAESNPVLGDAQISEENTPNGHISVWQASLSTGTWRAYNQGVAASKGTTKQVTDTCGSLERLSDIDVALVEKGGVKLRATMDSLEAVGMNNDAASAIFGANQKTDPEKMHGLAARYASLTAGDYYSYIVNGSGSGSDNTSIWFVTWGQKTCTLLYPQGSKAGLQVIDKGQQRVLDGSSNAFYVYETQFVWKLGLAVVDPRYVIRVCNIDVSDLTADAASGADLMDKMNDAYYLRPSDSIGENIARSYWYCNKTVAKFLHKQASNKSNVYLTIDYPAGKPVISFNGCPVHVCDAITSAEATIS